MTPIDLNPIVDQIVLPVMAPILIAAITWAVVKIAQVFHIQLSNNARLVVGTAIDNGINAAEARAKLPLIEVPNAVADVASYVQTTVPGALKTLKVSPAQLGAVVAAKIDAGLPPPPNHA